MCPVHHKKHNLPLAPTESLGVAGLVHAADETNEGGLRLAAED